MASHSVCGVFLSELIHFLTLTLSLTEFFLQWDIKNLRFIRSWNQVCELTWKTVGLGWVQTSATWLRVPNWVLAWFESQLCGFKSQAGFWMGQSSGTWVQVPAWGKQFSILSLIKLIYWTLTIFQGNTYVWRQRQLRNCPYLCGPP